MSIANTTPRISNLIAGQLPDFVRADHATFVAFLEAYYEWLEQYNPVLKDGGVVERAKNLMSYRDIDKTMDQFKELLYKEFLSLIPKSTSNSTKDIILKNVKDFYRAKGTEKSYRFLLRIITGGEEISSFYYPKQDVLRVSDGKWYIQKTIRLGSTTVNGVADPSVAALSLWVDQKIYGNTSNATAIIDQAQQFYENGTLINELTLSSITGEFSASEQIFANYDNNTANTLVANVFSGSISTLSIVDGGSGYEIGQLANVEPTSGEAGSGAVIQVSDVSEGNIASITVISGGAGFRAANDYVLFTGGGAAVQANAVVYVVDQSGTVHPNSYNIVSDIILYEANTQIGNAVYTNLLSANANTTLINALHTFTYANTGPIQAIQINSGGSGYISNPNMDVIANTRILALGILGAMTIVNAGSGYAANDRIVFENVPGGYGFGAVANVQTVNGAGSITSVKFIPTPGYLAGGSGYTNDYLPRANIQTVAGVNANVIATTILGDGESLSVNTGTIGTILSMQIVNPGGDYESPPYINLEAFGSGTANVMADVIQGLFQYQGRYLNDDGQISSYNFLQDRDYYQNYSYVLRLRKSLDVYKQTVLDIVHPAGMILFGEFLYEQVLETSTLNASPVVARVETSVDANAVFFDGTTLVRRNTASDGVAGGIRTATSNTGAISIWIRPNTLPTEGNSAYIFYVGLGSNNNSFVRLTNTKSQLPNSATGITVEMKFGAAAGTNVSYLKSDANSHPIRENTWIHILTAWNNANSAQSYMLIDNTDSTIRVANTSAVGTWNIANVVFGARDDRTNVFIGDISEVVLSNARIDLSNTAHRLLFANNNLPVNNVANVLINAGLGRPLVYFKGNAASFNVNFGVGGSFSNIIGTLTNSTITPTSELL